MVVRSVAVESRAVERFAVIRMRDADNQPRTLLQRFSVQVDRAVFGDEPMHVRAGGHHAGAEGQFGAILLTPLFVTEGIARIALPPSERDAP